MNNNVVHIKEKLKTAISVYRMATDEELEIVHDKDYIQNVKKYSSKSKDDVCKLEEQWKTYTSDFTYDASACAVGSLLNLVDAIYKTQVCLWR